MTLIDESTTASVVKNLQAAGQSLIGSCTDVGKLTRIFANIEQTLNGRAPEIVEETVAAPKIRSRDRTRSDISSKFKTNLRPYIVQALKDKDKQTWEEIHATLRDNKCPALLRDDDMNKRGIQRVLSQWSNRFHRNPDSTYSLI